jgi:hypothetical protein
MPPYDLPEHKTRSTVKSNSSKGGQGFNELRFEDKKGKEQLFLHAQRDKDERVRATSREFVGGKRHLIVKGDQLEKVEGDKFLHVKGMRQEKIDGECFLETRREVHSAEREIILWAPGHFIAEESPNILLHARDAVCFRCGESTITLQPDAIYISAPTVHINPSAPVPRLSSSVPEPLIPCQPAGADTGRTGGASSPGRSGRRGRAGASEGSEGSQHLELGEAERIDTEEAGAGEGSGQGQHLELGEAERIPVEEAEGADSGQDQTLELGEAERIPVEEAEGADSGQDQRLELGEAERIDTDEDDGDGGGPPPQP